MEVEAVVGNTFTIETNKGGSAGKTYVSTTFTITAVSDSTITLSCTSIFYYFNNITVRQRQVNVGGTAVLYDTTRVSIHTTPQSGLMDKTGISVSTNFTNVGFETYIYTTNGVDTFMASAHVTFKMPSKKLNFNGTEVNDVYFNGTKVNGVYFNGTKIK